MSQERTFPHGVPCWIDTEQSDLEAAQRFYGALLGWTFEDAVPPEVPDTYLIASLDGAPVAAIGPGTGPAAWNTYVSVTDCDATAKAVANAGGAIHGEPAEAGPGGRMAVCADPAGAAFRLWQPRRRPGVQVANLPGAWNFSDLRADDRAGAERFYGALFGWVVDGEDPAMICVPGYGDHLESTVDPDIRIRQANAPAYFADAVARMAPREPGDAGDNWHVTLSVADRDDAAASAERLGATVQSLAETPWSRTVTIRDPQGAGLTLSQFTPPPGF